METILLLGALGVCLYYVIVIGKKKTPKQQEKFESMEEQSQAEKKICDVEALKENVATSDDELLDDLSIQNIEKNGILSLTNVGPDMEDFDTLLVLNKHAYEQGNYTWHELECTQGNRKIWLEIENDDELEVSVFLNELTLDNLNLTPDKLEEFNENEEGEIIFEGVTYSLKESDEACFLPGGDVSKQETVHYWDFESISSEGKNVWVEKWSNGSYRVGNGELIKLSQIKVYSLKG